MCVLFLYSGTSSPVVCDLWHYGVEILHFVFGIVVPSQCFCGLLLRIIPAGAWTYVTSQQFKFCWCERVLLLFLIKLDVSMRPYPVTAINECSSNWKLHFWTVQVSSDSHDDDDDDDDDRIFNFLCTFLYMALGYCICWGNYHAKLLLDIHCIYTF